MSIGTRSSASAQEGGKSFATAAAQCKRVTPHLSVKSIRMGPHSAGKCLYCAWGKIVIVPVFQIDQWPVWYSSDSSAEGECTVGPGNTLC